MKPLRKNFRKLNAIERNLLAALKQSQAKKKPAAFGKVIVDCGK